MKFTAAALTLLAAPAAALNGGYLNQMVGGNAVKASTFMPTGGFADPVLVDAPAFSFAEMADDPVADAPAGDYLANMAGGSEMKESSFMPSGLYAAPQGPNFFDQFDAPFVADAPEASGDYLANMAGGSEMKASSFMPSGSYATPQGSSYLDLVGSPPAADASAAHGDYLAAMSGGSAMKASSFMPSGSYATPQGSPLDQVGAPAAAAADGDYLAAMGGGSEMKESSFMPSGSYNIPQGSSYLDNFGAASLSGAEGTFSGDYLGSMGGGSQMLESSFMPSGTYAVPQGPRSYLDQFASPMFSLEVGADGNVAASSEDYLTSLRTHAAESAGSHLPGYLDTLRVEHSYMYGGAGPVSYLDNLKGAATVTANVEAVNDIVLNDNAPVLDAIHTLTENVNRNHGMTIGVLQEINSSVQALSAKF